MAKIVLINGSMNPNSLGKKLLNMASRTLQKKGHDTEIICVCDTNFPLYSPVVPLTEEMNIVSEKIKAADAFIISSPEYHGGYSGALKNLLDYQDGSGFKNKTIALMSTSGGMRSGINTLNSIRLIFRSLHAHVIPQQISVCEKELSENNELSEEAQSQFKSVLLGLLQEVSYRFQHRS